MIFALSRRKIRYFVRFLCTHYERGNNKNMILTYFRFFRNFFCLFKFLNIQACSSCHEALHSVFIFIHLPLVLKTHCIKWEKKFTNTWSCRWASRTLQRHFSASWTQSCTTRSDLASWWSTSETYTLWKTGKLVRVRVRVFIPVPVTVPVYPCFLGIFNFKDQH